MRKENFANDEIYHLFNRGVDKREIFTDTRDLKRFFHSMETFNTVDLVGSIYENSFVNINLNNRVHQLGSRAAKLVDSSWDEYLGKSKENFCEKSVIPGQFRSIDEYKKFAESSLEDILERRGLKEEEEFDVLLLE